MNTNFESINHSRPFPARIFVTQINKCDFHWHYDYELFLFFRKKMAEIALNSLDQTQTSSLRTYSLLLSLIADLIDYVQYDIRRIPLGSDPGSENALHVEIFKIPICTVSITIVQ